MSRPLSHHVSRGLRLMKRWSLGAGRFPQGYEVSHIILASVLLADEALHERQTPVSMSSHFILRDPAIFPDPLVFQPERWLKQCTIGSSLDRYLVPFSKGSQGCLGPKYAFS